MNCLLLKIIFFLGAGGSHLYPSYSTGRDQEHHGSKPAWGNSSQDPILKTHHKKIGLAMWLMV
jgi:hypothetical protein